MKKVIVLFLALVMFASLAACGEKETEPDYGKIAAMAQENYERQKKEYDNFKSAYDNYQNEVDKLEQYK